MAKLKKMERLTWTIPECAKLLGISRNLAYDEAARGNLAGVFRVGKRLLVSRILFKRMLEQPGTKKT